MAKLPGTSESLPVPRSEERVIGAPRDPVPGAVMQAGATLSGIAMDLQQSMAKERERINRAQVEDAFNNLRNRQIDLSMGEDEGFTYQRGADAIKKPLLQDWTRKFDESAGKIMSELQNDEQRRAFKSRADVARSQYTQDILQHLARENGAYQKQVMGATIDTERRSAGLRWSNPDEVAASVARTKAAVSNYGEANGITGEALTNMQVEAASSIHQGVISQALANQNPAYAKLYFETYKKEIGPDAAIKIQSAIQEGTLRSNSQSKTDEIMGQYDNKTALQKAREITDPELRDSVVSRVKARIQENESLVRQAQSQAEDEAWKIVVEDGATRDSIPPDVWVDMSGPGRRQITDYLRNRDVRAARKTDDWQKLDEVDEMIAQGDITESDQLLRYQPYFTDSTFRSLRKKVDKRGKISATVMRRAFEDRLGKTRSKWKTDDREQWLAFQEYVLENVEETKRPEDLDSWADKWFMEGYTVEGSLFVNDPDTFGEARMAGREDFLIDAPDEMRPEVEKSISMLKSAGVSVPEGGRGVDEFYTRYHLDANRWFSARDIPATPARIAAYAVLIGQNKPVTAANIEYIAVQFR